jgi:hypothetical protein
MIDELAGNHTTFSLQLCDDVEAPGPKSSSMLVVERCRTPGIHIEAVAERGGRRTNGGELDANSRCIPSAGRARTSS